MHLLIDVHVVYFLFSIENYKIEALHLWPPIMRVLLLKNAHKLVGEKIEIIVINTLIADFSV